MTEIIEHIFLFCTTIIGCILLSCVVIIAILIALSFVFFLFSEYPFRTNFVVVILLLILGIPILYIPVLYLVTIASIWTIIGLFIWIFPFDESNKVVKESEPLSKEEVNINIKNKTTIEAEVPINSIFIEDFNSTSHSLNYNSHPGIILPFSSVSFNSNYNKYQEKIDSEAFKENNLSLIYDSGNYEDDDLCLKQEYIITFPATNIVEPSRLVSLEIDAPDLIFLKPNQERLFTVHGIDQFGNYIDPGNVFWRATGGKIDYQGRLIIENDAKGSFRVTAFSSKAKVSQHRLRQNLLLIKISLKIFSWVLSHKKLVKDTASYFIQEFCDSEVLVSEIFPDVDLSNIDGLLTILVFDDIKEWVIDIVIDIILNYLDKFVALCFKEESNSLICSLDYIVLPELRKLTIHPSDISIKPRESVDFQLIVIDQTGEKLDVKQKVSWKATGGSIDRSGKLTVNSNSQGSYIVKAIVGNSLNASVNYNVLTNSSDITISPRLSNPDSKQQHSESKAFWSATGGEIYSAEIGSLPTFIFYMSKTNSSN